MGVQGVIQRAYTGKGEITNLCFADTFVQQFVCELVPYPVVV